MGEPEQSNLEDAVRRAREEMHAATENLRALLAHLRLEDDPAPTDARSPGSAPNR